MMFVCVWGVGVYVCACPQLPMTITPACELLPTAPATTPHTRRAGAQQEEVGVARRLRSP